MESVTEQFLQITGHDCRCFLRFETDLDDASGYYYDAKEKQLYYDLGPIQLQQLNDAIAAYRNYLALNEMPGST